MLLINGLVELKLRCKHSTGCRSGTHEAIRALVCALIVQFSFHNQPGVSFTDTCKTDPRPRYWINN